MKILILCLVGLASFLGYVSTRDGQFHYTRSGLIHAPAREIYPYLSSFQKGVEWNPYDRKDPSMKRTLKGSDGTVGSIMEFEGSSDTGAGSLEVIGMVPDRTVKVKLVMTRPLKGENLITYSLTEEGADTRFTWEMSGDGGFEVGIQNLKTLIEQKAAKSPSAG